MTILFYTVAYFAVGLALVLMTKPEPANKWRLGVVPPVVLFLLWPYMLFVFGLVGVCLRLNDWMNDLHGALRKGK